MTLEGSTSVASCYAGCAVKFSIAALSSQNARTVLASVCTQAVSRIREREGGQRFGKGGVGSRGLCQPSLFGWGG